MFFFYIEEGENAGDSHEKIFLSRPLYCDLPCAFGWHKQGVSEYETENALAQCEYEAGKDHVERGDFVSNCMKRQGFRWY